MQSSFCKVVSMVSLKKIYSITTVDGKGGTVLSNLSDILNSTEYRNYKLSHGLQKDSFLFEHFRSEYGTTEFLKASNHYHSFCFDLLFAK